MCLHQVHETKRVVAVLSPPARSGFYRSKLMFFDKNAIIAASDKNMLFVTNGVPVRLEMNQFWQSTRKETSELMFQSKMGLLENLLLYYLLNFVRSKRSKPLALELKDWAVKLSDESGSSCFWSSKRPLRLLAGCLGGTELRRVATNLE